MSDTHEVPSSSLGLPTLHGGCSSVGRAPDCGSGGRGFEPRLSPKILIISTSRISKIQYKYLNMPC